ncbi:hypothetical protein N665_0384s0014 [Sinapis alba]|nr:hypothetical protein N665_0384s0014 [Sinapis alba]
MKREGRQHGFVRTGMIHTSGLNLRPTNQLVNQLDSSSAFGVFTKVPSKTTNHSKFTGKYEGSKYSNCHVSPAIKSVNTSKGGRKLQSVDWWIGDKLDQLIGSNSFSAKNILDTLCDEDYDGHVYEHDDDC